MNTWWSQPAMTVAAAQSHKELHKFSTKKRNLLLLKHSRSCLVHQTNILKASTKSPKRHLRFITRHLKAIFLWILSFTDALYHTTQSKPTPSHRTHNPTRSATFSPIENMILLEELRNSPSYELAFESCGRTLRHVLAIRTAICVRPTGPDTLP